MSFDLLKGRQLLIKGSQLVGRTDQERRACWSHSFHFIVQNGDLFRLERETWDVEGLLRNDVRGEYPFTVFDEACDSQQRLAILL